MTHAKSEKCLILKLFESTKTMSLFNIFESFYQIRQRRRHLLILTFFFPRNFNRNNKIKQG